MDKQNGGVMENNSLWAVNIPEEPDSEKILYPIPSKELGEQVVQRLRSEAIQAFEIVGECIAESITLEEYGDAAEKHSKYLVENPNWWDETTFLDGEVA